MKKLTTFITLLLLCATALFAQAPEKFTYQAVVRNASNALVANTQVGIRVNILQGTATGSAVYSESHVLSTNANGLVTVNIGGGSALHGSFAGINWADGPYFLKTDIDPNGGNDYSIITTQQLLSVPYALYAKDAGNGFSGDYNDLTNTPTIPTVPTDVSAFNNDAGYLTSFSETDPQYNAWNKDYNDLINKPIIPTVPSNVSTFVNDAGYITSTQVPAQVNADWNATSGASQILNKPTLFSGNYNDLTNKPNLFSGNYNDLFNKPIIPTVPTNVSAFTNDAGYITSANIPAIPTVPINVSAFTNDVGYITSAEVQQAANIPTVVSAFQNDAGYITISQIPTQVNADWNATSGAAQILNKPMLFSGNYNDLTNKPNIPSVPTEVSAFNNDAGYITMADLQALVNTLNNRIDSLENLINNSGEENQEDSSIVVTQPIIATDAVYNITDSSAKIHSIVLMPIGSQFVYGICWGTTTNPSIETNATYNQGSAHNIVYEKTVSGLHPNTTYYVRAYVSTSQGVTYGDEVSFTTPCPTVEILGNNHIQSGQSTLLTATGGENYTWSNGSHQSSINVSQSGTYWVNVSDSYGCTATASIDVMVVTTTYFSETACNSFDWNGTVYTESGVYSRSYVGSNGIMHIDTLLLTINHSGNTATTVTTSGSYTWINGVTYTASGTYTFTHTNINGCTQVDTLYLTKYNTYSVTAACGSYTWHDTTYTESGVYPYHYAGSLQVDTLFLTVYHPTNTAVTVRATGSYEWNGQIYTTSGTYIFNYTNINGCTQVDTLYLTMTSTSVTTCDDYVWNGSTYSTSGMYTHSYIGSDGLTKIDTLYLTILCLPTITTGTVSNITTSSATCSGNVTSDGGATVTQRGICWSTSANPTISSNHLNSSSGTGSFTINFTGLASGTKYYVRAYATNAAGTAYGNQITFTTTSVCPTSTVSDYDGNVYHTVAIGNQCWMKENLRTTHYSDGTGLTILINASFTTPSTTVGYLYCPNNSSSYVATYGYLYNWKAVMRNSSSSSANPSGVQGICPTGWHVPSQSEWVQLFNYVSSRSDYVCGTNSNYIAKALSNNTGWYSSTNDCAIGNNQSSNNATGFKVLPSGYYDYGLVQNEGCEPPGYHADFWSCTLLSDGVYACDFTYYQKTVLQWGHDRKNGYSVRCLRD